MNTTENTPSPKMKEFLDKVNKLCREYGYEFYPTVNGWTGKTNGDGEYETFACVGNGEKIKLVYLDVDLQN